MDNNHNQPDDWRVMYATNYNQAQQKVIRASGVNFSRAVEAGEMQYYNERPMMLDTWTQTSNADLGIGEDYLQNAYIEEQRKREKALLEKIRILKAELRAHSEMLTQMQSLHARGSSQIQKQYNRQQQQQSLVANPLEMQQQDHNPEQRRKHEERTSPKMQLYHRPSSSRSTQQCEEVTSMSNVPHDRPEQKQLAQNTPSQYIAQEVNEGAESTMQQNASISHNAPSTIINNAQEVRTRNVNYTIIADGDGNGPDEPIEIEIAEESAHNLNCSADSERLEICLAEEQQPEASVSYVKYEVGTEQIQHKNHISSSVSPVGAKRLKMSSENHTEYPATQIYEVRELSQETPQCCEHQSCDVAQPQPLLPFTTNRNNASLLKLQVDPQRRSDDQSTASKNKSEPKVAYCSIGPNNTRIPTKIFDAISWTSASIATRKLMMAIFNRETLATHSMTGKPSPAFKDHNKPLKKMLNPLAIQDIIFAVTRRCQVSEKEVRNAITTKCADENKMWKLALAKTQSLCEHDKENVG